MKAGRGLIQNVERAAGVTTGKLFSELDALGFAPGERHGALAQANVPKPHVRQCLQLSRDRGPGAEEFKRLVHRHFEHFVNALAAVLHFERLAVVAPSLARGAGDIDGRQEPHLHLDDAVALARFAAAARRIEGEAPGIVAALARRGRLRKHVANLREEPRVGRRVGARGLPYRALVNVNHLVDEIEPVEALVIKRLLLRVLKMPPQRRPQGVVYERGLPGARNAGHHRHGAHGKVTGDALQVVPHGIDEREALRQRILQRLRGRRHLATPRQVGPRERRVGRHDVLGRSGAKHHAPFFARARPHVHEPVRRTHHVRVMLHGDHGVARLGELFHHADELLVVSLMQPDRGLVQHIRHAGQP